MLAKKICGMVDFQGSALICHCYASGCAGVRMSCGTHVIWTGKFILCVPSPDVRDNALQKFNENNDEQREYCNLRVKKIRTRAWEEMGRHACDHGLSASQGKMRVHTKCTPELTHIDNDTQYTITQCDTGFNMNSTYIFT